MGCLLSARYEISGYVGSYSGCVFVYCNDRIFYEVKSCHGRLMREYNCKTIDRLFEHYKIHYDLTTIKKQEQRALKNVRRKRRHNVKQTLNKFLCHDIAYEIVSYL